MGTVVVLLKLTVLRGHTWCDPKGFKAFPWWRETISGVPSAYQTCYGRNRRGIKPCWFRAVLLNVCKDQKRPFGVFYSNSQHKIEVVYSRSIYLKMEKPIALYQSIETSALSSELLNRWALGSAFQELFNKGTKEIRNSAFSIMYRERNLCAQLTG